MATSKRVVALQHHPLEHPGRIATALEASQITVDRVHSYRGERVADWSAVDGLVVMGGPMGVYEHEKFPFLREEMLAMENALKAQKPVVGVCLGSQLLAAVLGSQVRPGAKKEIGWINVSLCDDGPGDTLTSLLPAQFTPLQWHGDVYDLPAGAVRLAKSELTEVQAFRYGSNAYGILFHLEIEPKDVDSWATGFATELASEHLDGDDLVATAALHLARLQTYRTQFFAQLAKLFC